LAGCPFIRMRTASRTASKNQALEAKRRFALPKVTWGLKETHARLIEFLMALPVTTFQQEQISRRIRLDTYEHYKEHAEILIDWLTSEGN